MNRAPWRGVTEGAAGRARPPRRKGKALINHVWMTRLDEELYSGLDDLRAGEEVPEVGGFGGTEPGEDVEGLP